MITDFSIRLKQLRRRQNMTQTRLAAMLHVTKSTVCTWENDRHMPDYDTIVHIADIFQVTVDFLLGRDERETLDLSGLSATEREHIRALVADMAALHKRLEDNL